MKIYSLISNNKIYYLLEENNKLFSYIKKDIQDCEGEIVKGKVKKYIKSCNAVLVDIGKEKDAFLSLENIKLEEIYLNTYKSNRGMGECFLEAGDNIIVQVVRNEKGDKGCVLSHIIKIRGNYLDYTPNVDKISFEFIDSKEDKDILYNKIKSIFKETLNIIIKKSCLIASLEDISNEYKSLQKKWQSIENKFLGAKKGSVLYSYKNAEFNERLKENIFVIANSNMALENAIKTFNIEKNENCIVDAYFDYKDKLSYIEGRKINLSCGGNIVIDNTEALTVIDVNSSSCILDNDKSVFEINCEAIDKIAEILMLRCINGIIIIDLINIKDNNLNEILLEYSKKIFDNKIKVEGFTRLGLLEISRRGF